MPRNPSKIPMKLILDPLAPIPPNMGKKDRLRLAELREAYQFSIQEHAAGAQIRTPEAAAEIFHTLIGHGRVEQLAVLALDAQSRVTGLPVIVTRGETDSTDAPPRAILRAVLVAEAVSFIVAHNHPSGVIQPSAADEAFTRKLALAATVIECPLQDSLIVINVPGQFYSLRRNRPGLWG